MNSILQDEKECFITKRTDSLQKHHIYFGAFRKSADRLGCWVWLTRDYHTGSQGVHFNRSFDLSLKKACQDAFEQNHSRAEFMRMFGRNYLD